MKSRFRLFSLLAPLLAMTLIASVPTVRAQDNPADGILAFVGVDGADSAAIYILDLASGRTSVVDAAVLSAADLAWHPEGDSLAFTTADGGYGLLRSLRGCFDAEAMCTDIVEVYPPFMVSALAWSPDGALLYLLSDEGVQLSAPRARPADIVALEAPCDAGFALAAETLHLFCARTDSSSNTTAAIYDTADGEAYSEATVIGTFPAITAYDIAPDGSAAIGTEESAGVSGFYAPIDGTPARLANYQIHVYDLEFHPQGERFALAGATSDSTGDGTLLDGDPGELFLFDTKSGTLQQIPGFTDADALTWSPDGDRLAIVTGDSTLALFTPETSLITPVSATLSDTDLVVRRLDWNPAVSDLPAIPTATPVSTSTPIPTPTQAATLTPLPTLTPWPTQPAFPTLTPFPSPTPGSPVGTGCQYAYVGGGGLPVAVGDIAEVTPYGAAVRLRSAPALDARMLAELLPGARMTIRSGPYCAQGYRWWEVQLVSNNVIGYLADSDPTGLWIKAVPAAPVESISFYADRYTISPGQCVTIRWDVEGIKEVYYNNVGVTGHENRQECPAVTTTYSLRVIRTDNSEVVQQITITVTP